MATASRFKWVDTWADHSPEQHMHSPKPVPSLPPTEGHNSFNGTAQREQQPKEISTVESDKSAVVLRSEEPKSADRHVQLFGSVNPSACRALPDNSNDYDTSRHDQPQPDIAQGTNASEIFIDARPNVSSPLRNQLSESRWVPKADSKSLFSKARSQAPVQSMQYVGSRITQDIGLQSRLSYDTSSRSMHLESNTGKLMQMPEKVVKASDQGPGQGRITPPHLRSGFKTPIVLAQPTSTQTITQQDNPASSSQDTLGSQKSQERVESTDKDRLQDWTIKEPRADTTANTTAVITPKQLHAPEPQLVTLDSLNRVQREIKILPLGRVDLTQLATVPSSKMAEEDTELIGQREETISAALSSPRLPEGYVQLDLHDVRCKTPIEIWSEQPWDDTGREFRARMKAQNQQKDETASIASSDLQAPTYLCRWIQGWMGDIPRFDPVTFILDNVSEGHAEQYEHCDVDPSTGTASSPVKYPATFPNPEDQAQPDYYRKNGRTSASAIAFRTVSREKKVKQDDAKKEHLMTLEAQAVRAADQHRINQYACKLPIEIHPAAEGDMEAVAAIYNREVQEGWRAVDETSVDAMAWQDILADCQEMRLPFVVAALRTQTTVNIIGFSFTDIAVRGVVGSQRNNSKHSAKLYVFVTPEYRRNRVGTTLLDAVLSRLSTRYIRKDESYEFYSPYNDDAYKPAMYTLPAWRTVQMEVFIKTQSSEQDTKDGEEYKFIYNWLERDFDLFLKAHFRQVSRAEKHPHQPWLDRLIFEHSCKALCNPGAVF